MALINCSLAPFINYQFVVTGAWGEPRSGHIHAGIDLATIGSGGVGRPVCSMSNGVVSYVDYDGSSGSGYGPYLIIKDLSNNDLWLYGDLSNNPPVTYGQTITRGQIIGYEGNPSGTSSTGLHVHVEKENQPDGIFKYGYANSIDPTTGTGIQNVNYSQSGDIYIYDGTPVPPTGTQQKKRFPWVLYSRKLRNRNLTYL